MSLNELKDSTPEQDSSNVGKTNLRIDRSIVDDLKAELGVSQNTEVAPAVAVAIAEFLDDDDSAENYREEFKNQFEEE